VAKDFVFNTRLVRGCD